ncbi:helix-turn-helix domain-containing protein [Chloroflexota bacterium]
MKGLKQSQLAKKLGVSKSYLSMILSGKRKCPPELGDKLQSTPGVHKVVNNYTWEVPSKQQVERSNRSRDARIATNILDFSFRMGYTANAQNCDKSAWPCE